MASYLIGAALLLGALLVSAGAMKLVRPRAFMHAVHRLLPGKRETETTVAMLAPAAVGVLELVVGTGLIAVAWLSPAFRTAFTVGAAVLYVGFTLVVGYAIQRGEACGCFGSFSDGPAGGAELGRSSVLAGVACSAAIVNLVTGSVPRPWPAAFGWAAVLACGVVIGAYAGALFGHDADAPAGYPRGVGFLLGRVTSSKSGQALIRVVRLRRDEAETVVEQARATPTGQALDEWLRSRGVDFDWQTLAARRSSMRTDHGVRRYLLLAPPADSGLMFTIAIRTDKAGEFEPTVTGDVDGCRLSITRGEVSAREVRSA